MLAEGSLKCYWEFTINMFSNHKDYIVPVQRSFYNSYSSSWLIHTQFFITKEKGDIQKVIVVIKLILPQTSEMSQKTDADKRLAWNVCMDSQSTWYYQGWNLNRKNQRFGFAKNFVKQ